MHTKVSNARAIWLAPALLAAAVGLLAAQDTLAPGARAPATVITSDQIGVGGITVGPNQVVDGDVVAPFGDVRIAGRVRGDVTVGKGNLFLGPAARVDGGVTVSGGSVTSAGVVAGGVEVSGGGFSNAGTVAGDVEVSGGPFGNTGVVSGGVEVNGGTLTNRGTIRGDAEVSGGKLINQDGRVLGEMIANDAAAPEPNRGHDAARSDAAGALRTRHDASSLVGEEVGDMGSLLVLTLLLGGIGAALIFYAYPRLERVSDEVRRDPIRAGVIGFVASILVLPAALTAVVGLALTIIGIPVIALVPIAVVALFVFALLGTAHALGERTAERSGSFTARHRNGYSYLFTGLVLLLVPLLAAHLLELTGFLSWLGVLVEIVAWLLLYLVTIVGLGAVVTTRAGGWLERRRHAANSPFGPEPTFSNAAGGAADA